MRSVPIAGARCAVTMTAWRSAARPVHRGQRVIVTMGLEPAPLPMPLTAFVHLQRCRRQAPGSVLELDASEDGSRLARVLVRLDAGGEIWCRHADIRPYDGKRIVGGSLAAALFEVADGSL